MNVLIDANVLSLALRRHPHLLQAADRVVVNRFLKLSQDGSAVLIGIVRQEMLSGLRFPEQFERLKTVLDGYLYIPTIQIDHDVAAESYNKCSRRGVAPGPIDMLICATAIRHALPIFTVDAEFNRYASVLPIRLYDYAK